MAGPRRSGQDKEETIEYQDLEWNPGSSGGRHDRTARRRRGVNPANDHLSRRLLHSKRDFATCVESGTAARPYTI